MREKLQRFSGAMVTPMPLFALAGIIIALTTVLKNPFVMGSIANEGTTWYGFWTIIEDGAFVVFDYMELLFVIALPLGLAKKFHARAAIEAFVIYVTFQYFMSSILIQFNISVDSNIPSYIREGSSLPLINGMTTIDTGLLGAIVISSMTVWLHNKFFEKKMPDYLGIFQGSGLIVLLGFCAVLPMAFITVWIWPIFQEMIHKLQDGIMYAGSAGVWLYTFLEKVLLPTGLHHYVYIPFQFGSAVVDGGLTRYWVEHLNEFSISPEPLKELFPAGGYSLHGLSGVFGIPGIAAAFYATSYPENRQVVIKTLFPVTLTAVLLGITEPFDYIFLLIAPSLFIIHAVLGAVMATTMYMFGVVGDMGGGLIEVILKNWLPLGAMHWPTYINQLIIGGIFIGIYFFTFRFLILKLNLKTPGRGEKQEEIKFHTEHELSERDKVEEKSDTKKLARIYIEALGGKGNIKNVNNCATRLRVSVNDVSKVKEDECFTSVGAHGVVRNGNAIQIIVGLSVSQVREAFEQILGER